MSQKNIVITGATSGIGRATAKLLAEKENKIIVLGRDEKCVATYINARD